MKNVLVTGSSGFIGSRYVSHHLSRIAQVESIVGVDKDSYPLEPSDNFIGVALDLASSQAVEELIALVDKHKIDHVFHLAADTSVDHSIANPYGYGVNNCLSTLTVFEAVRRARNSPRLINVSTDEVYGPMDGSIADESTQYIPTNPYSAAKAYGVMLASAYANTYNVNVSTTLACNTYGPRQRFSKLIPRTIRLLSQGLPVPIYGIGNQSRNWLHVDDHCRALSRVATYGSTGFTYNVGCTSKLNTIQVVNLIANMLGVDSSQKLLQFGVEDRLGHDMTYNMDTSAIEALGWTPQESVFFGIKETVKWYLSNQNVWKELE